jgi:SPP1 family predicted phage head-tail adaptor
MTRSPAIGDLRHRLTLETPSDQPDDYGGFRRSHKAAGAVWARIRSLDTRTQFAEQKHENIATHFVEMRWRSDITVGSRLLFGNRIFLIRSVRDPDERRLLLACVCEEIV